jgi:hypothetical protein
MRAILIIALLALAGCAAAPAPCNPLRQECAIGEPRDNPGTLQRNKAGGFWI